MLLARGGVDATDNAFVAPQEQQLVLRHQRWHVRRHLGDLIRQRRLRSRLHRSDIAAASARARSAEDQSRSNDRRADRSLVEHSELPIHFPGLRVKARDAMRLAVENQLGLAGAIEVHARRRVADDRVLALRCAIVHDRRRNRARRENCRHWRLGRLSSDHPDRWRESPCRRTRPGCFPCCADSQRAKVHLPHVFAVVIDRHDDVLVGRGERDVNVLLIDRRCSTTRNCSSDACDARSTGIGVPRSRRRSTCRDKARRARPSLLPRS